MAQIFSEVTRCGPVDVRLSRHDNNKEQIQVCFSACMKEGDFDVQPSMTFYTKSPDRLRAIAGAFSAAAEELETALINEAGGLE